MILPILLYNGAMAVVDLIACRVLKRQPGPWNWFRTTVRAALAAGCLAVVLGMSPFAIMRLATYGVFLHGPIVLGSSAVLLWSAGRKTAILSATAACVVVGVGIDAFLIEPTWLEVSHLRIASSKIQQPLRLVVLADLQTDQFGPYERMVLRRVLQEQPDVILLAGDYFQASGPLREELRIQLNDYLHEIDFKAPAGVFAVEGNIDSYDWPELFDGLPVTTLRTTSTLDVGGIRLTCLSLSDSRSRSPQLAAAVADRYHVVLGHVPNFALGTDDADLLIAGHTHGGQVRLPWIGPIMTLASIPRSWAAGVTDLPQGGKLLVSRGVGMERRSAPRLRFLCRPELVVIDLVPEGLKPQMHTDKHR
ncbi:MAG: metallophosphoesterase [Thermoguttaceae bacterium]